MNGIQTWSGRSELLGRTANRLMTRGFGLWSIAWGFLWLIAAIVVLGVTDPPKVSAVIICAALAGASLVLGNVVLLRVTREKEADEQRLAYRTVLDVARRHGGELIDGDVLADTQLSEGEVRTALERCVGEGLAEVEVDSRGVAVYRFHSFTPPPIPRMNEPPIDHTHV